MSRKNRDLFGKPNHLLLMKAQKVVFRLTAILFTLTLPPVQGAVVISEFQPNPPGSPDGDQMIELSGNPFEAYSGFISTLESDADTGSIGTIDRQTPISGNLDGSGRAVVTVPDFENPSFTVVFHAADGGGVSTDLDADDDKTLDSPGALGTIFDAISIPDQSGDAGFYGAQLGGADFSYTGDEPQLVFRSGSPLNSGNWFAINDPFGDQVFDIDANVLSPASFTAAPEIPTFGALNPTFVPEPSAALLGMVAMAAVCIRRRR